MNTTTASRFPAGALPAAAPGTFAGRSHGATHRVGSEAEDASSYKLVDVAGSSVQPSELPRQRYLLHQGTPGSPTVLRVDDEVELAFAQIVAGLRSARGNAGLTQNALSSQLPVRGRAISEWETGRMEPTLHHLMRWSCALDRRLAIVSSDGELWQGPSCPRSGETWESFERRRMAWPLRNRRKAMDLTQAQLGRRVGVSRDSIQRWELCRVPPRPIALVVWAQQLGCSVVLRPVRGQEPA